MLQRFKYILLFFITVYSFAQVEEDRVEIYTAPNSYLTRSQIENLLKRVRRDRYHVIEETSVDSLMIPGAWWRDTANHYYKYMDWAQRETDTGYVMYKKVWILNKDNYNFEMHLHTNIEHYTNSITTLQPYWTKIVKRNVTTYQPIRTALLGNFLYNVRINAIITDGYTDYTVDKDLQLVKHTVFSTDSIDFEKAYIEHYIALTNKTIYDSTLPYIYLLYKAVVKDSAKTYYENVYKVRLYNFPQGLYDVYLRKDITNLQYLKTYLDLKLSIEDNALYDYKQELIEDTVSYLVSGTYYSAEPLSSNFLYLLPSTSGTVPYHNALWRKPSPNPYYYTPPRYYDNGMVYGAIPDFNSGYQPSGDESIPVWNNPVYMAGGRYAFSLFPIYKYPLYRNLDTVGIYDWTQMGGINDEENVADVSIDTNKINFYRKYNKHENGLLTDTYALDTLQLEFVSDTLGSAPIQYITNNYYQGGGGVTGVIPIVVTERSDSLSKDTVKLNYKYPLIVEDDTLTCDIKLTRDSTLTQATEICLDEYIPSRWIVNDGFGIFYPVLGTSTSFRWFVIDKPFTKVSLIIKVPIGIRFTTQWPRTDPCPDKKAYFMLFIKHPLTNQIVYVVQEAVYFPAIWKQQGVPFDASTLPMVELAKTVTIPYNYMGYIWTKGFFWFGNSIITTPIPEYNFPTDAEIFGGSSDVKKLYVGDGLFTACYDSTNFLQAQNSTFGGMEVHSIKGSWHTDLGETDTVYTTKIIRQNERFLVERYKNYFESGIFYNKILVDTFSFINPDPSGALVSETDPTVPSHVKNITQNDINNWNSKDYYGYWQLQANGSNTSSVNSGDIVNIASGIGATVTKSGNTVTVKADTSILLQKADSNKYYYTPWKIESLLGDSSGITQHDITGQTDNYHNGYPNEAGRILESYGSKSRWSRKGNPGQVAIIAQDGYVDWITPCSDVVENTTYTRTGEYTHDVPFYSELMGSWYLDGSYRETYNKLYTQISSKGYIKQSLSSADTTGIKIGYRIYNGSTIIAEQWSDWVKIYNPYKQYVYYEVTLAIPTDYRGYTWSGIMLREYGQSLDQKAGYIKDWEIKYTYVTTENYFDCGNEPDGNNYTNGISFSKNGTTVTLNLYRDGLQPLYASFTDSLGSGGTADSSIFATRYWTDGIFLKKTDTTNKWQPKGNYAPTFTVNSPLTYSNNVIGINQASSSTSGYLSSTDWNTFNNKASTDWVSSNFSTLGHNHDGSYLSLAGGSLSGSLHAPYFYMNGNLVATQSWVSGNYSPLGHTHSGYATESWVSNNFSSISHTHSGYATQSWVSSNYLPLTGGTLEGSLVLDNGGHLTASGGVTGLAIKSIYGYTCNNYDGQSGTVSKTFVTNVTLNKTTQTINYIDKYDIAHDLTVVTDVSLNVSTATISLDFAGGICIGSNSWSGIYKEGEINLTMDEFEKLKNNTWQIDPEYLEFLQWKQWKKEQENKVKLATEKK